MIYLKAFIEYSGTMDDVYNDTNDYIPNRNRKILTALDEMIADMNTNRRFQTIVEDLFIKCRKFNRSPVFVTQSFLFKKKSD